MTDVNRISGAVIRTVTGDVSFRALLREVITVLNGI